MTNASESNEVRHVVGCMSGTSLDGLDVVLTAITGRGLAMRARFLGLHSVTFRDDLRAPLLHFAEGRPAAPIDYLHAARALGRHHARAVAELLEQFPVPTATGRPDFIVAHGQTIWHAPGKPADAERMSWQLFDSWPVVRALNVPVCYDLRQADLIAGGEGAPLTPMADWVMYRSAERNRVIFNLGGICNITMIPKDSQPADVHGFDAGPCNIVIDGVVRLLRPDRKYDEGGQLAMQGHADGPPVLDMVSLIRESPFFQGTGSRSTGREDFQSSHIAAAINNAHHETPDVDFIAATVDAVWSVIFDSFKQNLFGTCGPDSWETEKRNYEIVAAGGGTKNQRLMMGLEVFDRPPNYSWTSSDALGIPCEAREAMGFAVLGALSQDGVPISLPQVTGAKKPRVAGVWAGIGR